MGLRLTRRLLDRAKIIDPTKSVLTKLDDIAYFYKHIAGLKIDGIPPKGPVDRPPQGWVNMLPGSATLHIINEQRAPLPPGKWGRLILGPRGCIKSTIRRAERLRTILADKEMTTSYNCQNISMAYRTLTWVRGRLVRSNIVSRFGEFKDLEDWSKEQFTVLRDSGIGDNPTMIAGSPDKDVTGGHPLCFDLDDVVALKNNQTKLARRGVIEWFEALQDQRTAGATMEAIGTWWKGHNLWTEIVDNYSDEWEVICLGVYGPARTPKGKVVWDFPENEDCFPWIPESYWGPKKERNPLSFASQFMNQRITDEDAPFEARFLRYGEPPMEKDLLHSRLNVYMLTDTAQSERQIKGTSRTVYIVVAKDTDGMLYVLDITMGFWNPVKVEDKFYEMYGKWLPHKLLYATMETRGPGKTYIATLPQHAKARVDIDFSPKMRAVPRASSEDKDSRIALLYAPFSQGKIAFSKKFLNPVMFRIDSRGTPLGLAAEEYRNYSPYGDGTDDFMDALSDAMAIIDNCPVCPDPPSRRARAKEKTPYERAADQVRRQGGNIIVI